MKLRSSALKFTSKLPPFCRPSAFGLPARSESGPALPKGEIAWRAKSSVSGQARRIVACIRRLDNHMASNKVLEYDFRHGKHGISLPNNRPGGKRQFDRCSVVGHRYVYFTVLVDFLSGLRLARL